MARLLLIRRTKPLGSTLEELRGLLEVVDHLEAPSDDEDDIQTASRDHIADVPRRRDRLAEQLVSADEFLLSLQSRLRGDD